MYRLMDHRMYGLILFVFTDVKVIFRSTRHFVKNVSLFFLWVAEKVGCYCKNTNVAHM